MADEKREVKMWVTRHALTMGVASVDVTIEGEYAYSAGRMPVQYPPGHWHRTEAAAIARAEEMRVAKIASLERQIAKLQKLKFAATSGGKVDKR